MKIINIAVLYNESLPSRIYLSMLKKSGYKPRKIINVRSNPKNRLYKKLSLILGKYISGKLFTFAKSIRLSIKGYPINGLHKEFLSGAGLSVPDVFLDISHYAEDYEEILVDSFDDDILTKKIRSINEVEGIETILFTGGGILKEPILTVDGVKFIHIHPGIVPDIKGADGFFWSYLLRGKPGYSIFYMNPGIDTGDIIYKEEFSLDSNKFSIREYSSEVVYKSVLDVYDPILRITAFINMLNEFGPNDLYNLTSEKQNPNEGRVYFFLHPILRENIINNLKENIYESSNTCSRSGD